MRRGTLVHFDVSRGFGFIEPDDDASDDDASDVDASDDDCWTERLHNDVFVHIDVLRAAAAPGPARGGFPQPGQVLLFREQHGQRGTRATKVAALDGSWLALPLDEFRAGLYWERHKQRSYRD